RRFLLATIRQRRGSNPTRSHFFPVRYSEQSTCATELIRAKTPPVFATINLVPCRRSFPQGQRKWSNDCSAGGVVWRCRSRICRHRRTARDVRREKIACVGTSWRWLDSRREFAPQRSNTRQTALRCRERSRVSAILRGT